LTSERIAELKAKLATAKEDGKSQRALAKEFGISGDTIRRYTTGISSQKKALVPERLAELNAKLATTNWDLRTHPALAEEFGVSRDMIHWYIKVGVPEAIGRYGGRRTALNTEEVAELKSKWAAGKVEGKTMADVAREFGIGKETMRRYIKGISNPKKAGRKKNALTPEEVAELKTKVDTLRMQRKSEADLAEEFGISRVAIRQYVRNRGQM
jgi:transcriptional regulator with XRE-family HTH domain